MWWDSYWRERASKYLNRIFIMSISNRISSDMIDIIRIRIRIRPEIWNTVGERRMHRQVEISNWPCRATDPRAATGCPASGPCLYGLRAWPSAQGMAHRPVFVSCWPTAYQTDNNSFSSIFSPNAKIFHYFHQYIAINSTYISHNYTNSSYSPGHYRTDSWNGPCRVPRTGLG